MNTKSNNKTPNKINFKNLILNKKEKYYDEEFKGTLDKAMADAFNLI